MANNNKPKIVITNMENIEPKYSNYVQIGHSAHEFMLTFSYIDPAKIIKGESPEVNAEAFSRIIIAPSLLPGIIKAFEINQKKYNASIKKELEKNNE